ncbi:phage upper tail fiber protein [Oceanicella actignis]|uniref:Minor tail protein gp31 C-terminal domain-containing protein n=1 Tax=Oceanicella actignis TaxID=1189325 RepID=A0A1M7U1D3_9RHOB|nr:hypothetical protein [Oceanicella actignis]SES77222.1 hypothetical protein SAMN04488119_101415 [Oceanicella actignis]SHN76831.1 hypothetical protein SAMN05216200_1147 [Oceanicella actignis]
MTERTRADFLNQVAAKVDTTGQGGTSGQDLIDLLTDAADSFAMAASVPGATSDLMNDGAGDAAGPFVASADVARIVTLTQAEYDALAAPDAATLYIVNG